MPRKYENIHVCPDGDYGRVAWGCTCNPGEGERITAIDERDIEPLVGAAREVLAQHLRRGHPTVASARLRAALATYEDTATEGGDASAGRLRRADSTPATEPRVDDGSGLLHQALAALDEIAARPTIERNPDGVDQAAETMALLAREHAERIRGSACPCGLVLDHCHRENARRYCPADSGLKELLEWCEEQADSSDRETEAADNAEDAAYCAGLEVAYRAMAQQIRERMK